MTFRCAGISGIADGLPASRERQRGAISPCPAGQSALDFQPPFIIAIDGPAGAGKGTLATRLADYYHLNHLDTGLTYRAVAHALLSHGLPLENASAAETAARQVDLTRLDRATLSAHAVGEAASKVAVIPAVRRVLVEKQRDYAKLAPGAVLDGRDIGTVVCPDADVKLYVTASAAYAPDGGSTRSRAMAAGPISPKSSPISSGATRETWAAPTRP